MNPVENTEKFNDTQKLNKIWGYFSTRSDVVNKGLLRSIKSYYLKKFKKLNYTIVRRRFTNVKTSECVEALEEFLKAEFENDDISPNYRNFAKFMVVFLNLKSTKSISFEKSIISRGLQVQDWMRKYSYTKFENLHQIEELNLLALKVRESYLDEVFEAKDTINQNKELYKAALDELINNFNK